MTGLRRALIGLAALAFALGIGTAALVLGSDHQSPRGLVVALVLISAWGFVGTGLYAWDRRPGNNVGPLMTAVGFAWFLEALSSSDNEVVFAIGALSSALPFAVLIHLLVTFPSGRLETRLQKALVGLTYVITTIVQFAWGLFVNPAREGCDGCPENPILIEGHASVGDAINAGQALVSIGVILAVVWLLYRRWRDSSADQRRALTPVLATGGVAFALLIALLGAGALGASESVESVAFIATVAVFACLPFAFLVGLLRSRIGRDEEIRTQLTAENEQLTAELRAKVAELRASRTRIVEAGYEERRRVERDLHDGAQQRLVALTMSLRLVRGKIGADPDGAAELLDEAMAELDAATRELRELARGIHPAVLSDRGLEAAVGGLADRSSLPVQVLETPAERLPAPVESATYFVVAEALTNVARYARAQAVEVRVARDDGAVEVEVRDDGVGGADATGGTGLRGLEDRVAALDGELIVTSPEGRGTVVRARIPLGG
jgi:signal transduction histidine kinase